MIVGVEVEVEVEVRVEVELHHSFASQNDAVGLRPALSIPLTIPFLCPLIGMEEWGVGFGLIPKFSCQVVGLGGEPWFFIFAPKLI